ncbi:TIGR02099 family protein [Luteimonas aestuarii]|uniref:TIGR02099 family protein n=1 Tax=Luteimonas aestuarii TaxID=453837 RepID=A0A4R5TY21_9GAMM|nr:YhdP family protein [Luteimonas aestuarii]TDK26106.1 TIGR02099 family protein [Luteimonas aestuarii]
MTTPLRRRLRFAGNSVWYLVVALVVAMALGAVAFQQALAMVERHPARVAAWLGERAGRPVAFDALHTEWTRRGPLLRLEGLRVGEGGGVSIGEAEILVAQYEGLLPGRSFTELRLRGLHLSLVREDDGRWQVRGLPGQDSGEDPFAVLEGLGELQVLGGGLEIHAPGLGIDASIPRIDLRMRVDGPRVRAATRAWMQDDATPVDAVVDVDRTRGDGRLHAALRDADLATWSDLARHGGVAIESGRGRAQAWATLRGHRIASVTADAELANVVLRGASLGEGREPPRQRVDGLSLLARVDVDGDDWQLVAPRLRIGPRASEQVLDGLEAAGGDRFALRARRIDAGPLIAAFALGEQLPAGLRAWLLAAAPTVVLHDIDVSREGAGRLQASARVEALRFDTVDDTPGLSGLGGVLRGDGDGFAFTPDPEARLRFDWPSGFGAAHVIRLRGDVAGWRDGDAGLRIETPSLRVEGEGYAADVRGGMRFGGGRGPAIDLVAGIDEAMVPVAKKFWVRHRMSDATEQWLDDALVSGRVRGGRAVVSGELEDWPFSALEGAQAKGVFDARGELVDMVVKFQPDWPAAERLNGIARFHNDGFTVDGAAELSGVPATGLHAALPHYSRARLAIRATTDGEGAKVLSLLRASPLHAGHGEALDNLSVEGRIAATFAMDLPLDDDPRTVPAISGEVQLHGATLAEQRWKLAFNEVRGAVRYDQHGFSADSLAAVREEHPASVSLRAGDQHVRDGAHAFEADIDAMLPASDLLAQAPELDWLAPHVRGSSRWTLGLAVLQSTRAGVAGQTRLQLRSNLVGTTLDLPQPLRKPAAEPLATTVQTTFPLEGGEVAVGFGQRLALRARERNGRTGVRVMLGTSTVTEAPPESGLVATGRTPALDAIDWATLATGGDGDGLALRGIDVTADRLQLLGSQFPRTRVLAAPEGDGVRVTFDGPALAGRVQLPDDRAAPVVARLQRMHWASAAPLADAASAPRATRVATDPEDEIDPAAIPPLRIEVDDLRFGALALGTASLHTQPTATGLQIDRLQARSDAQRIDASGSWSGRGAAARTQLSLAVDSADVGALVEGAGFGRRIHGGKGALRFDAQWPHSPAAFDIGTLEGNLTVALRDGRLAEVEPGAGRVLGLLSVAELPRRMMLDFRDFFSSGFAFNRIDGAVAFARGEARSDDMVIDGPAAELRIQGRSDLRAQTHDQRIDVLPKTGNLLPAVGAIAGGPVGAAVGAVANAVLRGPLGELNAKTYRVTGMWDDPKVEVRDHQPVPRASSSSPPASPEAR